MRKVYCTLDTETLGGCNYPKLAYHIAGIIHDREGKMIASFNYLVAQLYDQIRDDEYHKEHFDLYERMIEQGVATFVPTVDDAVNAINSLLTFYNVDTVMAYNASFDLVKGAGAPLIENRDFIDIWLMACETIAKKKSYSDFCHEHGFSSTSKKSCSTSAQTMFAYLMNDPEYKEEHTAFSDSFIEMSIFLACCRAKKRFTQNQVWYDARGFQHCPKW